MRDILTVFAILLIVALTTVLVAPYFVDWNGQRAFLETRLSRALGQRVTIGGHIDLKLLPTPYLVLDQVVVGDDEAPLRIGVHHLDLELSVTPLMHGEFDIVEARLEEPSIKLTLAHGRALPTLPAAPAFAADVRFDRIHVSDGTLAVADPESGRSFVLDHLDLDADAGSLAGPFKLAGAEGAAERRTKFRLATSAIAKGEAHARLIVEETAAHAGADFDGTLAFEGAAPDTIRQTFEGTVVLAGHLADLGETPAPWKLSGPLHADSSRAAIDGGEMRLGGEDAGVTLKAGATLDIGDTPRLALDLTAKHLDLDRLAGAPVDAVKPPPPKLPDLATLRRALDSARPPFETRVDLAVDDATYAGETLSNLAAHIAVGGAGPAPLKLAADGPGGAHVALDGRVTPASTFQGSVDLAADNLGRTLDWLRPVAPSLPLGTGDPGFDHLKLAADVTAGRDSIEAGKLALTLERSVLTGKARLDFGTATPKLAADLRSDALELDDLPSLASLRGATRSLDLDLRLGAKALEVARVGDGPLHTGPIDLLLAKRGREIDLRSFRAADLGGATIGAKGHLGPEVADLSLTLDAAHVEAVAALVRQLAPGDLADALVRRAASLAPAKIAVATSLEAISGDRLTPARLSLNGTLGRTKIAVTAKPDAGAEGATSISASLTSPDGNALVSQLGLPTLPIESIGSARVALDAHGHAGDALATKLTANFGPTTLDVKGAFDVLTATPKGKGTLRVESPDTTPLLQALAIAFPDMTGRMPASLDGEITLGDGAAVLRGMKGQVSGTRVAGDVTWRRAKGANPTLTGTLHLDRLALADLLGLSLGPQPPAAPGAGWSREPFTVGLVDPPRASLALSTDTLDITSQLRAKEASLTLDIAPNLIRLDKLAANLSGGKINGMLALRRDGRQASAEGKIALDRVAVRLPSLDGTITGNLDVAGGGASPAALVASLAGSGTATASGLQVQGGDPAALPKIFADVEADNLAVDQEAIVRAFSDAARAPLPLGTRHYALGLAAGVLHVDPKDAPARSGAVSSALHASYDLGRSQLEVHLDETLDELPKNWTGPPPSIAVTLRGPPQTPARSFDVSGFLDAVAARALARETARIEAYEADIRERAFFNARLQSEARREADRQKVEDDARKEAERKARVEAARRERLRAEAAAKAAREAQPAEGTAPGAGVPPPPGNAAPPPDPSAYGRY